MKIYTKKGDDGTTALMNGKRINKNSLPISAIGDLDELNAFIGLAKSKMNEKNLESQLYIIQSDLFVIGSSLADTNAKKSWLLSIDKISQLEMWIDDMEATLPPLKNFILPGGSEAVALIHICRTVCRRAERALAALSEQEKTDEVILKYLNRLSDFFFVCARFIAFQKNEEEIIWKPAIT